MNKDLVAASARPLLLSVLSEGENYGYAIIKRVRQLSDGEIQWNEGMLYPVLHRLEREGLVEARWQRSDAGRRRKYYRLKTTGREAMILEQKQWLRVHSTLIKLWNLDPHLT